MPKSSRRDRSGSSSRSGSASNAAWTTSWRGRNVWISSRPPRSRGPRSRAAFVSSAIACSLARYRGARSSRSKSRKATTSARSTRWSTASVPTYTPASGGGSWSAPVTATTGRPAAASSSSRSRVTPGRRLANPDAAAFEAHRRSIGSASGAVERRLVGQAHRRVAPLAPGERATGPAREHASSPRRVVDADDPRVGPAKFADQRRRQERRLPRLLVRAVDDVDDRPAGTFGAHREANGHIAERRHARDARARRRGEQRDAGPPGPFDEHIAGVPRRRPLLLQRLVVLVDHDHHRELGARGPRRGPSPDDDIDTSGSARPTRAVRARSALRGAAAPPPSPRPAPRSASRRASNHVSRRSRSRRSATRQVATAARRHRRRARASARWPTTDDGRSIGGPSARAFTADTFTGGLAVTRNGRSRPAAQRTDAQRARSTRSAAGPDRRRA